MGNWYTLRFLSEIYIPDLNGDGSGKKVIAPLKWHDVECPKRARNKVGWAISYIREHVAEGTPFEMALDMPRRLECLQLSDLSGDPAEIRLDVVCFDGEWTDRQISVILSKFPTM